MKYIPLKCQKEGLTFTLKNKSCALFFRMGVGKTVVALTAILKLIYDYAHIRRVLVVAPIRVAKVSWPDEIDKWEHTRMLSYVILHGPKKDKLINEAHKKDITLINYEGLIWAYRNHNKFPSYDMVILDESTFIKTPGVKRTKIAHKIARFAPRRILLTGSPTPNGLENLWSQMFTLDRGKRLGSTITEFRRRYMFPDTNPNSGNNYFLKTGAKKEILNAIRDICMVVEDDGKLGIPKVVHNPIHIELPAKLMKQYKKLEEEFYTVLDSGNTIETLNQQAQTQKLRQFIAGFVYEDNYTVVEIHKERLKALKELSVSLDGENLLIAIQFREDVRQIRDYMKMNIPAINSETPGKLDIEHIRKWNEGKLPWLMAHPRSIAHGLNLQSGGCNIVWYNNT